MFSSIGSFCSSVWRLKIDPEDFFLLAWLSTMDIAEPRAVTSMDMYVGFACGTSTPQPNGYDLAIQTHLPLWQMDPVTLKNSFLGFPSFIPLLTWVSFLWNIPRLPFSDYPYFFPFFEKPRLDPSFSDTLWRVLWMFVFIVGNIHLPSITYCPVLLDIFWFIIDDKCFLFLALF